MTETVRARWGGHRLSAGEHIADGLVVRGVIGTGTSATVYEATHERLGRRVAVKVVHRPGSRDRHAARFCREAALCRRVHSAHVPDVHGVGELDDGSPYLVMERLRGETLEPIVARGPVWLPLVFEVGHQLLHALEAVHRAGALHRDVKPDNVVLSRDSSGAIVLKLVDFGISRPVDAVQGSSSDDQGMVQGTPHYMAPEQVRGDALDERADVYGAAAVLYEMITGQTPYRGDTADEVMAAVGHRPVVPPGALRRDCPSGLDRLVLRALSPDVAQRPPSARAFKDELEHIAEGTVGPHAAILRPCPGELPSRFSEGG